MSLNKTLDKRILSNGLTVIVDPINHLPQVSMELLYHVGSKDEKSGEKGLAHLIEHMLFKGTEKLSETDVAAITNKISGSTNAFTNQDVTAYVFSMPSGNWKEGLKIYADCMKNARFDTQMLNSELKAVIQELKMRKDSYALTLLESMISSVFHDHPYHYPIIGFKQDLWNLERDTLYNFYKKHYLPNNAVLVVVGDVDAQEVFQEAEKLFALIKANGSYKKETFYHGQDLSSKSVTLYRDIKLPQFCMQVILPGLKENKRYLYSFLERVLTEPKTGRLSRKLVDELKLVSRVNTVVWEFEDASTFFIMMEPYKIESCETIKEIIHEELQKLLQEGVTDLELLSISRKIKLMHTVQLESYPSRAHAIASSYKIFGDEQSIFTFADYPLENVNNDLKELLKKYFSQSSFNYGYLLPLQEAEKAQWTELQKISDEEDFRILDGKTRTTEVETPRAAQDVLVAEPTTTHLPLPQQTILSNGVKLFYYDNKATGMITITVTFKVRGDYDHEKLYGLHNFMARMLTEGTLNYSGNLFEQECQKYGIVFNVSAGVWSITFLPDDFEKALELLRELLTNALCPVEALEKVRDQMINMVLMCEEDPGMIAMNIIAKQAYKDHPWSTPSFGTRETLAAITQQDVQEFYKKVITHDGMRVGIVGNITDYDVVGLCEKYLGNFKGQLIDPIVYPELAPFEPKKLTHELNRDQVTLTYFCRSIGRLDSRYDIYTLFQQIFGGASMSSRLFKLRQQSGLFYGIYGFLMQYADTQPGCFVIQTQVSQDRVTEAREVIENTINTVVDTVTQEELDDAKKMLITQKIQSYANNYGIVSNMLHNERFGLGDDYNRGYAQRINKITLDEMKNAVRDLLNTDNMSVLEIGRIQK